MVSSVLPQTIKNQLDYTANDGRKIRQINERALCLDSILVNIFTEVLLDSLSGP